MTPAVWPDLVVPHPVDIHGALGRGRVDSKVDPGIAAFGTADITHPRHVGLTCQDVQFGRLGCVRCFTLRIG